MKQKYTKKIVKYFDSIVDKTVIKLKNKTNYFFQKDTKANYFYKFLISFIAILFFYLLYLSIPSFYNKTWVQNTIENKLIEDFKIDFSVSADISYNILPSPHFLIKDVKIFVNKNTKKKKLSEIKKLKIFIDQKYFFNKDININEVTIHDANFSLQGDDILFLNSASHKKFSNKMIKIHNGNVFFKDNENEIVAITKIKSASLFYDDIKKLNLFNFDGQVFNIPFNFNLNKEFSSTGFKEVNLSAKKLKLKIKDKSEKKSEKLTKGTNIFSFFNSKLQTEYIVKKKLISFEFDKSKIKNSNIKYKGSMILEPFELELQIDFKKYYLHKLINPNSIFGELIKSKLLFNEKLSTSISLDIASNLDREIFSSTELKFNIVNGKINFDKTRLFNDKIGFLEINNSFLFFENDNFVLSSDIVINIKNSNNLFSFFQTPKKYRKPIKNIIVSFNYDLIKKQIDIKGVKIDGIEGSNEMFDIMKEISYIENYNLNRSKRLFNKIFSAYAG